LFQNGWKTIILNPKKAKITPASENEYALFQSFDTNKYIEIDVRYAEKYTGIIHTRYAITSTVSDRIAI
jgi:hypothetical protein